MLQEPAWRVGIRVAYNTDIDDLLLPFFCHCALHSIRCCLQIAIRDGKAKLQDLVEKDIFAVVRLGPSQSQAPTYQALNPQLATLALHQTRNPLRLWQAPRIGRPT